MRDVCQCESRGCRAQGGVQWDTRIIQKHRLEDQLKILEDAKADSERAVQEELDHISQHLTETTLADTPVHAAADDLCHRLSDLHLNPKSTSSENPSQRSAIRVRDVVAHLSEIEAAVASLRLKVAENIGKAHSTNGSGFALDPLLRDCYRLQANLSKVTLKAAPVTAMKEGISQILLNVQVQLEAQKSERVKEHSKHTAATAYTTGMIPHWIYLLQSSNHH